MRVLDLFSGIGGFSLGLERAGMETVAFCEREEFCMKILRKHWPQVPIWDDVKTLKGSDVSDVDLICGGFPCQDISYAGKGAGIEGERSGLWSEFHRLIGEIRPSYVIVENVAALLGRGLPRVLGDLAEIGYDAEWNCIPASYLCAPHRRDRVWIVSYPSGQQNSGFFNYENCLKHFQYARESRGSGLFDGGEACRWSFESQPSGVVNGVPPFVDRVVSLGNSVVPQISELIGRVIWEHSQS